MSVTKCAWPQCQSDCGVLKIVCCEIKLCNGGASHKFPARHPADFVVFYLVSSAKLEPCFPEFRSLHSSGLASAAGGSLLEIWKVAVKQQPCSFFVQGRSVQGLTSCSWSLFCWLALLARRWLGPWGSASSEPISSLGFAESWALCMCSSVT